MTTLTVQEAQGRLNQIIDALAPGDEVILTRGDRPVAKLTGGPAVRKPRRLGTMKGTVLHMADDFDAPLEDFQEYMQ